MPIDGLPGGDFSGCVTAMTGEVDSPEAFCASKIHELTGKWPAQENEELVPDAARATEKLKLSNIQPREDGPYPGALWNVTLIGPDPKNGTPILDIDGQKFIRSKNGLFYRVAALRDSVEIFNNCRVYDNHLTDKQFEERQGMRSFKDELAGAITDVGYDEGNKALIGVFRVGDRGYAQKLHDFNTLNILESSAGLSIDTFPVFGKIKHEGKTFDTVEGFKKINSTDVVTQPAAGGAFERQIAADIQKKGDSTMTEEEIREMVKSAVAEALAAMQATEQVDEETPPEEVAAEVEGAVMAAVEELPADAPPEVAAQVAADAAQEKADEIAEEVMESEKRIRKLECKIFLSERLTAAKLPDAERGIVEAAFKGRIFEEEELDMVIQRAKEAQASHDPTGQPTGAGGNRDNGLRAGMNEMDKLTIGLMQMLAPRIPVIQSLRNIEGISADYVQARRPEAMRAWINGGRENYRPRTGKMSEWLWEICGYNPLNMRAKEANDVSSITKNAVNLFLAAAYSVREEWWEPITSSITVDTIDDVTLVRDYGLSDLAIVEAGGPYVDQELSDDEETGSHIKHGNTISVTLEDMLLDKLDVLSRIPTKLANSWYNTKSSKAAAVFTVNTATGPVLSDTGALFNATALTSAGGHANLLTAALSFTAYSAVNTAMQKQTDKKLGAGNRLLARPKFVLVPVDLETTAEQIRNSQHQTNTANNDVNPYFQKFEVIVVPNWTDANNWAAVADPMLFPAIFDVKVRGFEVPQIFTAGDETSGAVFTNDTWRWKARLMTYRFSDTYDCMPVADFRGLHKSNVA